MILVHDNRSKAKSVSNKEREGSRKYSVDAILSLVSRNDSMEIQILSKGKRVEIGSQSAKLTIPSHMISAITLKKENLKAWMPLEMQFCPIPIRAR